MLGGINQKNGEQFATSLGSVKVVVTGSCMTDGGRAPLGRHGLMAINDIALKDLLNF